MRIQAKRPASLFLCLSLFACGNTQDASSTAESCTPITAADLADPSFQGVPACSSQMFAKYGDAGFQKVNSAIAGLAIAAPVDQLGDSFQTKIVQATKERQAEFGAHLLSFLEFAYGSTTPYVGPDMTVAHKPLNITVAQYNYFVSKVVVPALQSVITSDPNDDISKCFAPVLLDPAFKKTVIFCK